MKSVEIIINASGQLTINAIGFNGTDCEKATAFLDQALGSVSVKEKKPEFYRRNQRGAQQKAGI